MPCCDWFCAYFENQGIFWQELLYAAVRWCKKQALKSVFHPIGDKLASNEFISGGESTKSEHAERRKKKEQNNCFLQHGGSSVRCLQDFVVQKYTTYYSWLICWLFLVTDKVTNQFDGVRGKSSQMPALIFLPVSHNSLALGNPSSA